MTAQPRWYEGMDDILGDTPTLTPDELHAIALRQSYSLDALFARHAAELAERLVERRAVTLVDALEMAGDAVAIDAQQCDDWYAHMEREYDVTTEVE